jgi:hypothetical protein
MMSLETSSFLQLVATSVVGYFGIRFVAAQNDILNAQNALFTGQQELNRLLQENELRIAEAANLDDLLLDIAFQEGTLEQRAKRLKPYVDRGVKFNKLRHYLYVLAKDQTGINATMSVEFLGNEYNRLLVKGPLP